MSGGGKPGDVEQCRICGADIIWAVTANSKHIPSDAEPVADGTLFLFRHEKVVEAVYAASATKKAKEARARGQRRYASHYVTCKPWRK